MIWSGCGRKRLWPAVNKYPDSRLECLKAGTKLINNTVSNQQLKSARLGWEENCEILDTGTEIMQSVCIASARIWWHIQSAYSRWLECGQFRIAVILYSYEFRKPGRNVRSADWI